MLPLLPSVTSLFPSPVAIEHRRRAVPARFPLVLLLPTVHMQALTQREIVYNTLYMYVKESRDSKFRRSTLKLNAHVAPL